MTDQIRELIEALADYCEAPNPRRAGADLWDRIDAALGPRDARQASTAAALRALLPTRDPRVDPQAGDLLLADGDHIMVVRVTDGPAPEVWSVCSIQPKSQCAASNVGAESLASWRDWSPYGGIDAVQVLYVAPDVTP